MPPRKSKSSGDQMVLGKAAPSPRAEPRLGTTPPVGERENIEPPRLLRYLPLMAADQWQVERFDLLTAVMGITLEIGNLKSEWAGRMQLFHEFTQGRTKVWLLVRRLYGIAPLVPGPETHPDDLKIHTPEEVVASGLVASKDEIAVELETLRGLFAAQHPVEVAIGSEPAPEDLLLDDALLEKFGFSKDMFNVVSYNRELAADAPRAAAENRAEQIRFCEQLRHEKWQKMLAHKMYGSLASDALMSQLYLWRVQKDMAPLSPSHPRFQSLSSQKTSFVKQYQDQLDELQKKFPELAISNETGAKGVISDLMIGQRDYYASNGGNNKLINHFCTAYEMEWMMRQAVQRPSSFRFGMSVAFTDAARGIYDPNFRPLFKPSVLKLLDAGHRAAADIVRTVLNEPVVNLAEGVSAEDGDQFEDFQQQRDVASHHSTPKTT